MAKSDLHYMGAVEALDLFRKKKLSPVELMDAVIARAQAVQPTINSLSQTFFDEVGVRLVRPRHCFWTEISGISGSLP